MSSFLPRLTAAIPLLVALSAAPALAQEEEAPSDAETQEEVQEEEETAAGLSLELNRLALSDNGCLFTFVAGSELGSDIEKFSYEVALFDGEGLVERMTVLDFQDLPAGSTRVRQFNLPETDCGDISEILINDSAACKGTGLKPCICMSGLTLESRADVEFTG